MIARTVMGRLLIAARRVSPAGNPAAFIILAVDGGDWVCGSVGADIIDAVATGAHRAGDRMRAAYTVGDGGVVFQHVEWVLQ